MKKLITAGAAMICMATAMNAANETKTVELRIVETSDVHGSFFPYDFISRKQTEGTLCRVHTYVSRLRKEYGDRLLLLDNGDILQGQPSCYYSNYVASNRKNVASEVINYMGYDCVTMGNHDVETGHAVYDKWTKEVRCPMLGANIIDRTTGRPYLQPYAVFVREGVKIAVLGMLSPAIPNWLNESLWSGLQFQEMVECTRHWVEHIRRVERADIVVGLFHSGLSGGISTPEYDENATAKVASQVPGLDIIFFGHDHIAHNDWIENEKGDSVLCLNPSCFARNVAEATISLTYENGKLKEKHISGAVSSMADEQVDRKMLSHFQPFIDDVKKYVERRIGYVDTTLNAHDCFFGSSPFTDLVHNMQLELSHADISFAAPLTQNGILKKGALHVADMFKLYRYENRLCVLRLTGEEIRQHLEMSYDLWVNTMRAPSDHIIKIKENARESSSQYGFENPSFNFDSAAGIEYEVDVTKPDGEKVHVLRMSNGEPFDDHQEYRVVMNSYRANGGGELLTRGAGIDKDSLQGRTIYESPLDLRHYLMEVIERHGTISPKANGNWRYIPEEWAAPALERDRRLIFPSEP